MLITVNSTAFLVGAAGEAGGSVALSALLAFFAGDVDGSGSSEGEVVLLVALDFDFLGEATAVFAAPLLLS